MIKSKAVEDYINRLDKRMGQIHDEGDVKNNNDEDFEYERGQITELTKVIEQLKELLKNQVPISSKAVDYIKYTGDNIKEVIKFIGGYGYHIRLIGESNDCWGVYKDGGGYETTIDYRYGYIVIFPDRLDTYNEKNFNQLFEIEAE